MTDSAASVLRRFGPMVYLPTLLFAFGEGAVIPLFPVLAAQLGADVATSGLIASFLVVGQLCGNIPAGWAVARFGERITMAAGGAIAALAAAGMLWAPSLGTLAASVFVVGISAAVFGLARQAFMTTRVPLAVRARALSLLGGAFRLGTFVGPFVTAMLVGIFAAEQSAIWFFMACMVGVTLLVMLGPDPERAPMARPAATDGEDSGEPVSGSIPTVERIGALRTMWRHRDVLARMGLAAAALSGARAARQIVLPLWGVSIGLDAQTIAVVVGISGAIDFALFYASGQVMDRFGRLWAALPAMTIMGAGFVALAFAHDATGAPVWFTVFAGVLGLGNGLSSGILLTLGADLAPQEHPAPFLGSWRTIIDAGGASTPMLISGVTAVAGLPVALGLVGVVALAGGVAFARFIPRYTPHTR